MGDMAAAPPRVEMIEYEAFGERRPARVELPPEEPVSIALILSGVVMFGLDAERPATRGLLEFGDLLAEALLASGRGVVRPEPFRADRDAQGCISAANSLDAAIVEAWPELPGLRIGLSAAVPLIAVASGDRTSESFVLISPPILETYGNRPDRIDLPLAESLGIPREMAAELGGLAPMHAGASVASHALIVHGSADRIVPPADAIGWRASLAAGGVEAARLEIAFAGHDLEPCRKPVLDAIIRHLEEVGA